MTFGQLIHELECDYGRINFRERLMLRRAYDVVPEKEDKSMCDTCTKDKPSKRKGTKTVAIVTDPITGMKFDVVRCIQDLEKGDFEDKKVYL